MNNFIRHRRLRQNQTIRDLMAENLISPNDFIVPIFVVEGQQVKEEIPSMPNYFRISLDGLEHEINSLWQLGLKSVLLFVKVPQNLKDNQGKEALNPSGLMQRSIKKIKEIQPNMLVFTDVALDPYSEFGHDGVVQDNQIVNDKTIEILAKMALSHAQAGADFVAPSDMMDGRVAAIRNALDSKHFFNVGILSYAAKYASSFYGPFRDALDSAPGFGDKKSYQMDFRNSQEALREVESDLLEGADLVMVKPGLPYLDVIFNIKQNFNTPVAAYQVSGEYAMIKAAAANGWINYKEAVLESIFAFKRAGCTLVATYFAKEVAAWLKEDC